MSAATEDQTKPELIERTLKSEVDDVDKTSRTVTSIVTTDAVDHYDEVIVPKGIDLTVFKANPVVLWSHDSRQPIGKSLWIKLKGNTLLAKTQFAKFDRAMEIFELYADGFLNGWSIGARVEWSKASPPTPEEIKARRELASVRLMIRRCTLLEYSAVAIPANPEALGNDCERSISKELLDQITRAPRWEPGRAAEAETEEKTKSADPEPTKKRELPPLIGRTLAEVREEQRLAIRLATGQTAARRAAAESLDRLKGQI